MLIKANDTQDINPNHIVLVTRRVVDHAAPKKPRKRIAQEIFDYHRTCRRQPHAREADATAFQEGLNQAYKEAMCKYIESIKLHVAETTHYDVSLSTGTTIVMQQHPQDIINNEI